MQLHPLLLGQQHKSPKGPSSPDSGGKAAAGSSSTAHAAPAEQKPSAGQSQSQRSDVHRAGPLQQLRKPAVPFLLLAEVEKQQVPCHAPLRRRGSQNYTLGLYRAERAGDICTHNTCMI